MVQAIQPSVDIGREQEHTPPYQTMLRAIGQYLDGERAECVRIIESAEGFVVHHSSTRGAVRVMEISWSDLLSHGSEWARRPGKLRLWRARPRPRRCSYEDLLTVVGDLLDGVHATSILLDELPGGVLLSYQFLNPAEGYMPGKRRVVLRTADLEAVVQEARSGSHQEVTNLQRLAG